MLSWLTRSALFQEAKEVPSDPTTDSRLLQNCSQDHDPLSKTSHGVRETIRNAGLHKRGRQVLVGHINDAAIISLELSRCHSRRGRVVSSRALCCWKTVQSSSCPFTAAIYKSVRIRQRLLSQGVRIQALSSALDHPSHIAAQREHNTTVGVFLSGEGSESTRWAMTEY